MLGLPLCFIAAMPCVNIARAKLCAAIGLDFSKVDFEKLCFEFGIELDDEMFEPNDAGVLEAVWKVEIPANRYDLLCVEGLARAIRVFLRLEETPVCPCLCCCCVALPPVCCDVFVWCSRGGSFPPVFSVQLVTNRSYLFLCCYCMSFCCCLMLASKRSVCVLTRLV